MAHPEGLKQWIQEVSSHMGHLSKSEVMVLALYSFGMVLSRCCGLSTIVYFLGMLLEQKPNSLRQRLREWNYESEQKRGEKRQSIKVSDSFCPLLTWLVSEWDESEQNLALAMDVTYLGSRFTILAISVLYRGCAIPVAWRILAGDAKGEWQPIWLDLLAQLQAAIPEDWQVFVLTDRGLYAKWLFESLCDYAWHPLMRINKQGLYQRKHMKTWKPLASLVRPGMGIWCERVRCFKGKPLACTLLVQWDADYDEAGLIATDLAPEHVKPNHYNIRFWIECGFKDVKRGGLRWEQTKMTEPTRAERLWLVMAVALIWLVSVGGEAQEQEQNWLWRTASGQGLRNLSCVTLGWLVILVAALRQRPLPMGRFLPYDWHKVPL